MGSTVPKGFIVTDELKEWAKKKFQVDDEEVERQEEEWRDHEYKRSYSHWDKVWRNWWRRANEFDTIKRPMQRRTVEKLTDEQRQADILAFERDPLIRAALKRNK